MEEVEEVENCEAGYCEKEIKEVEKQEKYTSRFDEGFDNDARYKKLQITEAQELAGFIIYARWSKPSLRIKKNFTDCGIDFLDVENYMKDLQGRNIKKVPAIILKDKVINGYFEVRDYLRKK